MIDLEQGGSGILKRLTLTFRDLTVNVTAADAALGQTLLSVVDPRQLLDYLRKRVKPKRVR
jgi:ATP-binding cassette subfamily G (WHITE) protein 2 (SNQ2)